MITMGAVLQEKENFQRARELVLEHGWNTTCYQIINPGIEYWFGRDGRSVVGYVTSVKTRVVAGAPVCTERDLGRIAAEFERDSHALGYRVCYFGAEARLENVYRNDPTHADVLLGAQPVWHPVRWAAGVERHKQIRAQLNRAQNKGVVINEWPIDRARDNPELKDCLRSWLDIKGLPPLHFVIEPETLGRLEGRRIFVAERDGRVEAFLVLSPIPTRKGWLTEQFPHRPGAPNGTVEFMMDAAIRQIADEGAEYVTLGLSPLSKRAAIGPFDNPWWLRFILGWMRKHGRRFYNFDGLDFFKAKLAPDYWEPVFAIVDQKEFSPRTLYAIGNAFADNRPLRIFASGLWKAAAAEIGNLRRFIAGRN
jgi:lysylphosphatidylglycerol synthetase-like protein (DUF2156 family)